MRKEWWVVYFGWKPIASYECKILEFFLVYKYRTYVLADGCHQRHLPMMAPAAHPIRVHMSLRFGGGRQEMLL